MPTHPTKAIATEILMKKILLISLVSWTLTATNHALAQGVNLPIQLDYSLIKKALLSQLYTGAGHSADVWHDKHHCSFLQLSDPQLSGQSGQLRFLNNVSTQFGTSFGGQCITLMQWNGILETLQQPTLSQDHTILSLPVTKATAYDRQGHALKIDKLQELLTHQAQPWLAKLKIDLKESRGDIDKTLTPYLPPERIPTLKAALDTLVFTKAEANDNGVAIGVIFDAPQQTAVLKPEAALSAAEQLQWQNIWAKWDASFSKAIDQSALDNKSPALRSALTDILSDARIAVQAGLKQHDASDEDPVRVFFTQSWERLSPLLSTVAKDLPEIDGLRYLSFITATDVIYALESRVAPFGLALSSDGLRRLARTMIAAEQHKGG
jgi:hypothetical protein